MPRERIRYIRVHDIVKQCPEFLNNKSMIAEFLVERNIVATKAEIVSRIEYKKDDFEEECCGHKMPDDYAFCPYCGHTLIRDYLFLVADSIPEIKSKYQALRHQELPRYEQRLLKAAHYLCIVEKVDG